MIPFRKILFPVDFSNRCRAIALSVGHTVEKYDAELMLLHATDPVPVLIGSVETGAAMPMPDFSEVRRHQKERLAEFATQLFPELEPTLLVQEGEAGRVVCDVVRHNGADLVMLPTHGHGALRRFLLGSVTAKVLHDVDCAVWTDTEHPEYKPALPYRRILCTLNLDTDEADAVIRAAACIAQEYKAELLLVHAVETPPAAWEVDYAPYRQKVIESANIKMQSLRREAGLEGTTYEIADGRTPDVIHRIVAERQVDLVVTGRGHAQDGLGRIWSNLYSIIREAPCPVLSI